MTLGEEEDIVTLEGEQAHRLAAQLLPAAAKNTQRVEVRDMTLLPGGGMHTGFVIKLVQPMLVEGALCIEPFTELTFPTNETFFPPRSVALDFPEGTIPDHWLAGVKSAANYHVLTDAPAALGEARSACEALVGTRQAWTLTYSVGRIRSDVRTRAIFLSALPQASKVTARCISIEVPQCSYGKGELIEFIELNLPYGFQRFQVPDGDLWRQFSWGEALDHQSAISYEVIAKSKNDKSPADVVLKITRSPRPQI